MTEATDLNRGAHVALGIGALRTLYPVVVLRRGERFAQVRFLVDCDPLGVKKSNVEYISTDILLESS